ncbi:helix-turn-helix domain-containing protein [Actinospica sp.]|uniref:PucR family transcriptional regulator n=1 Tax=Actinospica sp. TaxID=1872142 RepID=UPI002C71041E|nr:helix-turn-helix domain-containing protein [Actinospica sp.]HWG25453.1 helix-turn-helix domain-containing protein [Actinospica sp.]
MPDPVGAQVALLGTGMLERADELADEMVARIREAVPVYRSDAVITAAELRRTCLENIDFVFAPMGHTPARTSPESRDNGRRRALAGVPLTSVMEAYRVSARFLWERLAEPAATGEVAPEAALRAATEMWLVLDTFTQEMAEGYREELTSQTLRREAERSAVMQALLEGRLDEATLCEAADILCLPTQGPYFVIAAQVPEVARHAFPRVQHALRPLGAACAWSLLHDVEVGIAQLPGTHPRIEDLADALDHATEGHVGISPPYRDLRNTADALKLAKIALRGACDGQRVTVFDRDPLAIAAASAPQIMRILARTILGPLDQASEHDRALLLATFGAWLDADGSADRAAAALFCHPNTVRHRLRRLQDHTGRSLSQPRELAELALAFEVDRRITDPAR